MSVPPVFPADFYKMLVEGAKKLGMSRVKFAMDAVRHYLKAIDTKDAPAVKALGSEELAQQFSEAHRKIAKNWWKTISAEERAERSRKALEGRWGKKKK